MVEERAGRTEERNADVPVSVNRDCLSVAALDPACALHFSLTSEKRQRKSFRKDDNYRNWFRPSSGAEMWVKICGIRDVETAARIVSLRPDAVGLNFFEKSPRHVDRAVAAEISITLPTEIDAVGLFVNHELNDVADTAQQCGLTMIQLHGDEPPEFLAELKACSSKVKILRAFRVDDSGLTQVADYLAECRKLGVCLTGCLIDARVDGEYGGTGCTAPWDLLADQYDSERWPRLIVAGGLHPGNLADAIRVTRPFGVDVASGVESERGVKDLALVEGFIQAARQAD